jgi:hypothetical protein
VGYGQHGDADRVHRGLDRRAGAALQAARGAAVRLSAAVRTLSGTGSLSVAACLYIMKDLSLTTMHVFTIWMTCAILIYLFYGLRNSRLNRIGDLTPGICIAVTA